MVDAAYRAAATGRRVEFQALPPRGMGA
jgi:hypothetical protein